MQLTCVYDPDSCMYVSTIYLCTTTCKERTFGVFCFGTQCECLCMSFSTHSCGSLPQSQSPPGHHKQLHFVPTLCQTQEAFFLLF